MPPLTIIVVGAGIIGASTALALQQDGHRVTLLDREHPCAGTSFGHAGGIINGYCTPTAMPGIAIDALRMLGKPLSPLSIRPAYFHRILPWLIRFVNESRRSRVLHNAQSLHALSNLAVESWLQLTANTTLNSLLETGGWLKVYESEHAFAGTREARALMDKIGSPYEVLGADDIQQLEPQLAPIFNYAIFQPNSLRLINPQRMVQGMVDLLISRGGRYQQFNEQDFTGRVTIQSFDWRTLQQVQKQAPAIPTSYLTAQQDWFNNIQSAQSGASVWTAGFNIDNFDGNVAKMVKAAGGQIWSPHHRDISVSKIKQAHALGLKVKVWTVNNTDRMQSLINMGVDGIITDYPDQLRMVLKKLGMSLPEQTAVSP